MSPSSRHPTVHVILSLLYSLFHLDSFSPTSLMDPLSILSQVMIVYHLYSFHFSSATLLNILKISIRYNCCKHVYYLIEVLNQSNQSLKLRNTRISMEPRSPRYDLFVGSMAEKDKFSHLSTIIFQKIHLFMWHYAMDWSDST